MQSTMWSQTLKKFSKGKTESNSQKVIHLLPYKLDIQCLNGTKIS